MLKLNIKNALIGFRPYFSRDGYCKKCTADLNKANIDFSLFDQVVPNCPEKLIN